MGNLIEVIEKIKKIANEGITNIESIPELSYLGALVKIQIVCDEAIKNHSDEKE